MDHENRQNAHTKPWAYSLKTARHTLQAVISSLVVTHILTKRQRFWLGLVFVIVILPGKHEET